MRRSLTWLLLLAIGVGCASGPSAPQAPPPTPEPTPEPVVGATLPRWDSIEAATGPGVVEYRIAAGDVLDIMVFGHPEMRKELPVRPDGKISYRLVGTLHALPTG
jgi:hypothetical protein